MGWFQVRSSPDGPVERAGRREIERRVFEFSRLEAELVWAFSQVMSTPRGGTMSQRDLTEEVAQPGAKQRPLREEKLVNLDAGGDLSKGRLLLGCAEKAGRVQSEGSDPQYTDGDRCRLDRQ